jgi:hypothetical protein
LIPLLLCEGFFNEDYDFRALSSNDFRDESFLSENIGVYSLFKPKFYCFSGDSSCKRVSPNEKLFKEENAKESPRVLASFKRLRQLGVFSSF